MNDLLELILKKITTYPDSVSIEKVTEAEMDIYNIKVHDEDMGRVIGKNGNVIKAIRTLAHVAGIRSEKRVRINLVDSGQQPKEADDKEPDATTIPTTEDKQNTEPVVNDSIKKEGVVGEDISDNEQASDEIELDETAKTIDNLPNADSQSNQAETKPENSDEVSAEEVVFDEEEG